MQPNALNRVEIFAPLSPQCSNFISEDHVLSKFGQRYKQHHDTSNNLFSRLLENIAIINITFFWYTLCYISTINH